MIHTVGPIWRGSGNHEEELLARCYGNSLALAAHHNIRTIAFPAISTGVYGFPIERAAKIAIREALRFCQTHETPHEITFVCFGDDNFRALSNALKGDE